MHLNAALHIFNGNQDIESHLHCGLHYMLLQTI